MLTGFFKFSTTIYFLNRLGVWVRESNNIPPPPTFLRGFLPRFLVLGPQQSGTLSRNSP